MESVIFSNTQGSGYISTTEIFDDPLSYLPVVIVDEILVPGVYTDVRGYFSRDLKYIGLKGDNELIFYIGSSRSLFEIKHYWQSLWLISPERLYQVFGHGSGRDFNWIRGEWR